MHCKAKHHQFHLQEQNCLKIDDSDFNKIMKLYDELF